MATPIEIVGAALAVPGVIDVIVRGADVVYERVQIYRKKDATVSSFQDLALDIKQGTLFYALDTIRGASKDRAVPHAIKDQLDKSLEALKGELELTKEGLTHVHDAGGLVYTLWRGKGSHHQLVKLSSALKGSCDKLKDLCLQLQRYRTVQSSYLWTTDTFKLRHETPEHPPGRHLPWSDILIAAGNYSDRDNRVEAEFILERKGRENDVRYLCSVLNRDALNGREGILPVLGYRQPPYNDPDGSNPFQMLIQIPPNVELQSLAHYISSKPRPDLVERLRYCLSVARALASVHAIGLVHKAVRPRAILTPTDRGIQTSPPVLYLQDWSYIREISGATTQLGEESWQKAMYQHPERQGKYAEAAYQPKHDIYSLGVNMLEILLWEPFVLSGVGPNEPDRVCSIFETTALRLGETNGGLPDRYRGDAVRLMSRPRATKTTWCEVATSGLTTPDGGKDLVLNCLNEQYTKMSEAVRAVEEAIARHP